MTRREVHLEDYHCEAFAAAIDLGDGAAAKDYSYDVWHRKEAPSRDDGTVRSVILMHELYGMSIETLEFAEQLFEAGYRPHLPLFFGTPGKARAVNGIWSFLCMRRLFAAFERDTNAPLAQWVRALAAELCDEAQQPVGLIGMCMTGSMVFAAIADPNVTAPIAAQPSLPFGIPFTPSKAANQSNRGFDEVVLEGAGPDREILMLRYSEDGISPLERLETITTCFGRNQELDLPASRNDPATSESYQADAAGPQLHLVNLPGKGHATLTNDQHPAAVEAVIGFLNRRFSTA